MIVESEEVDDNGPTRSSGSRLCLKSAAWWCALRSLAGVTSGGKCYQVCSQVLNVKLERLNA